MLAIEFIDELTFSALFAAWPAIRADLGFGYSLLGMLLAVAGTVGNVVEPPLHVLGDAGYRRRLVLGGGVLFALGLLVLAASPGLWPFVAAFIVLNPASGAFVGLSQATLMDLEPRRQVPNMARWALAGSLGMVGGAALLWVAMRAGFGWRGVIGAIALLAAAGVVAAWRITFPRPTTGAGGATAGGGGAEKPSILHHFAGETLGALRRGGADALGALRRRDVVRWLVMLQFSDLMLDVLLAFLALYLVDVAGATPARAALAVGIWTSVGLAGDWLLIPLLERVDGLHYLRASAAATLALFSGFLLVPAIEVKLVLLALLGLLNSGWYAILQGELYSAMPGRSGTVLAVANIAGFGGALLPVIVGVAAQRAGLDVAMWLLAAGPVALLIGLRRRTPTGS